MSDPSKLYLIVQQLADPRFTSLAVIAAEKLDADFQQTARDLQTLLLALQRQFAGAAA